jgi:hypothetical protein
MTTHATIRNMSSFNITPSYIFIPTPVPVIYNQTFINTILLNSRYSWFAGVIHVWSRQWDTLRKCSDLHWKCILNYHFCCYITHILKSHQFWHTQTGLLVRPVAVNCYKKTGIMDLMDLGFSSMWYAKTYMILLHTKSKSWPPIMHRALWKHLCNTGAHKTKEWLFMSILILKTSLRWFWHWIYRWRLCSSEM